MPLTGLAPGLLAAAALVLTLFQNVPICRASILDGGEGKGQATQQTSNTTAQPWELELEPWLKGRSSGLGSDEEHPPQFSGGYRGNWLLRSMSPELNETRQLPHEEGLIILQVKPAEARQGRTAGTGADAGERQTFPDVQDIEGELLLRDGRRSGGGAPPSDIRFRLRGVYVAATGSVHGALELNRPIEVDADEAELRDDQPLYRSSLRAAAWSYLSARSVWELPLHRPPAGVAAAALRRRLAQPRALRAAGAAAPSPNAPPPSPPLRLRLRKTCEFRLDLQVYYAGSQHASEHASFYNLTLSTPPAAGPHTSADAQPGKNAATGASAGGSSTGSSKGLPAAATSPQDAAAVAAASAALATRHAARSLLSAVAPGLYDTLSGLAGSGGAGSDGRGAAAAAAAAQGAALGFVRSGPGSGSGPTVGLGALTAAAAAAARRRLLADTEIYHNTQVQLHTPTTPAAQPVLSGGAGADVVQPSGADGGRPPAASRWRPDPDLDIVGVIYSPNCGLELAFNGTSLHLARYYRKGLYYCATVASLAFVQLGLMIGQLEAASTPSAAARMSLHCVLGQAVLDAYACLLHMTSALVVEPLFGALAGVAFLQFLLFAVFEMRQALEVWRAQAAAAAGNMVDWWASRHDMSYVYTRFYGLLLTGVAMVFVLQPVLPLVLLVMHSWWLPQILRSAVTDTRPPLRPKYLWGTTLTRLFPALYFFGCPVNVLKAEHMPYFCVLLAAWVFLLALLLYSQMLFGPRWLVPSIMMPRKYNYNRAATRKELGLGLGHNDAAASSSSGNDGAAAASNSAGRAGRDSADGGAGALPSSSTTAGTENGASGARVGGAAPAAAPASAETQARPRSAAEAAAAAALARAEASGFAGGSSTSAALGGASVRRLSAIAQGSSARDGGGGSSHSSGASSSSGSGGSDSRPGSPSSRRSGGSSSGTSWTAGGMVRSATLVYGNVVARAGAARRALAAPGRALAAWVLRRSGAASALGGYGPTSHVDVESGHGSRECVICMNPVPVLPVEARMLTPCGHFYHEGCLVRWMDVKMDCPTCRRPLPPR